MLRRVVPSGLVRIGNDVEICQGGNSSEERHVEVCQESPKGCQGSSQCE